MKPLHSWNRLPRITPDTVQALSAPSLPDQATLPFCIYGNGRSYGDVCLSDQGTLLHTRTLDRFIHFDRHQGILRCQSGVTLEEILQLIVPHGWFLPSTPGTRYATVGGCLANDVHGKNHHEAGSFGHHVTAFELIKSDGEALVCSPDDNHEYFYATIGGLGLTGLISWVEIQLMSIQNSWMWVEAQRFGNLDEFWYLNEKAEQNWPYTVAWIDCLARNNARGRGILLTGQHAASQPQLPRYRELPLTVPVTPPFSLINNLSLRSFNNVYYRQPLKAQGSLCHYSPYFYPLDAIQNWNRIYGHKGFYQYQCVLPPAVAPEATSELLKAIAASGQGSFLAVLKTFGQKPSRGLLSFPRPGATLALDFPNRGERTLKLFETLDAIVMAAEGALYPAKDARMPAELFRAGYPDWEKFCNFVDPAFSSHFWRRMTA
ncbi:MAG: FAD-binding oxidoreductase [Marinobacterium sp.]|nr:FAD-binding oxidoreductase [Marinobacterium sp.]